jgi:protein-S-isoprenylcysteine O-methyltransferase Ste14
MILGVILFLMGIVFALQGADILTDSPLMSGNSTYIYVGAVVALIGLALLAWSSRMGRGAAPSVGAGPSQPASA